MIWHVNNLLLQKAGDLDDDSFYINSTMVKEFKSQQQEAAQLREDLASAKTQIFQLLEQINQESLDHANQMDNLPYFKKLRG
jgi:hypothetical protein